MLKFFRRIRRKLLDKGNLKRYLIYALGEILLVVVGILIALQVNNWNEARKSNAKANQLSAVLYAELLEVKDYHEKFFAPALDDEIKNTEFFLKNWETLSLDTLKKFRQEQLKFSLLKNSSAITGIMGFQYFYDPEFPFYKTAVNDGTISIVKNKEFINRLSLIYIQGSERMDFFEQDIGGISQTADKHILQNYDFIFADPGEANGAPWSERAINSFFKAVETDNKLRYLVDQRLSTMKTKKYVLTAQIMKNIDKAIESYNEPTPIESGENQNRRAD